MRKAWADQVGMFTNQARASGKLGPLEWPRIRAERGEDGALVLSLWTKDGANLLSVVVEEEVWSWRHAQELDPQGRAMEPIAMLN